MKDTKHHSAQVWSKAFAITCQTGFSTTHWQWSDWV